MAEFAARPLPGPGGQADEGEPELAGVSDLLLERQGSIAARGDVLAGTDDEGLRVDVEVDRLSVYLGKEDEVAFVRW